MPHNRLHLTSPELLRLLMEWAPNGEVTAPELAATAQLSRSKAYALLSGDRPTVDRSTAERIAARLHVAAEVLFRPRLPTPTGMDIRREDRSEHERTIDAAPVRGPHELGEHPGPREPHRRRP